MIGTVLCSLRSPCYQQKRSGEDLLEALELMGHTLQRKVTIELTFRTEGRVVALEGVPSTAARRRAILDAARLADDALATCTRPVTKAAALQDLEHFRARRLNQSAYLGLRHLALEASLDAMRAALPDDVKAGALSHHLQRSAPRQRPLCFDEPRLHLTPAAAGDGLRWGRRGPEHRLQELFGLAETPRLGRGRVPVLLHLLAPSYGPEQVTSDLASFWREAYHVVRKDLRSRYPKPFWPAAPLRGAGAALRAVGGPRLRNCGILASSWGRAATQRMGRPGVVPRAAEPARTPGLLTCLPSSRSSPAPPRRSRRRSSTPSSTSPSTSPSRRRSSRSTRSRAPRG